MKEKLIKGVLFVLMLLALTYAKAQNPYLLPYKFKVKVVKISELGEYELTFKCDTKGKDFGLRLDNVSMNDQFVHVYGLSKWDKDGFYTFTVRTSLVPRHRKFSLIIRDMYMIAEKSN